MRKLFGGKLFGGLLFGGGLFVAGVVPPPVPGPPTQLWAAPDPGRLWVGSAMPDYVPPTYSKSPAMVRTYGLGFGWYDEIKAGGTIASASVQATPGSLTVVSTAIQGSVVAFQLSGGTNGITYDLVATATLADGSVLQQNGFLEVKTL